MTISLKWLWSLFWMTVLELSIVLNLNVFKATTWYNGLIFVFAVCTTLLRLCACQLRVSRKLGPQTSDLKTQTLPPPPPKSDILKWKADQCAKKVVSDSQGLVDFAIGLVISIPKLHDGQMKFFWGNSNYRRTVTNAHKIFLGLVEMTFALVRASYSLPEWQAVTDFLCTLADKH